MAWMGGSIWRSTILSNSGISRWPETLNSITGRWFGESANTRGSPAASGSRSAVTRLRISDSASSRSALFSKLARTVDRLPREVDVTSLRPSIPMITSSTGLVTSCDTWYGVPCWNEVETLITPRLISGKSSCCNCW